MKERLIQFIRENDLSPFNQYKSQLNLSNQSIFKTRDAKAVHNKVILKISQNLLQGLPLPS